MNIKWGELCVCCLRSNITDLVQYYSSLFCVEECGGWVVEGVDEGQGIEKYIFEERKWHEIHRSGIWFTIAQDVSVSFAIVPLSVRHSPPPYTHHQCTQSNHILLAVLKNCNSYAEITILHYHKWECFIPLLTLQSSTKKTNERHFYAYFPHFVFASINDWQRGVGGQVEVWKAGFQWIERVLHSACINKLVDHV